MLIYLCRDYDLVSIAGNCPTQLAGKLPNALCGSVRALMGSESEAMDGPQNLSEANVGVESRGLIALGVIKKQRFQPLRAFPELGKIAAEIGSDGSKINENTSQ